MRRCRTAARLAAGRLDPTEEALLSAHLATCESCRARQADVAALSGLVADGLLVEAARRDFSSFSDGVMAASRPRPGAAPRPDRSTGCAASSAGTGVLAAASALVPALAAVALYLYIGRSGGSGPWELSVEVTSENLAAVVLDTSDGPVILVGEGSEGT